MANSAFTPLGTNGVTSVTNSDGSLTISPTSGGVVASAASKIPKVLFCSGVAASITGTTTETVLATYTLPANTLPANGVLRITTLWSSINNGNIKTAKIRFNGISGSVLFTGVMTSRGVGQMITYIYANNSTSAQKWLGGTTFSDSAYGALNATMPTSSVNTTSNVDIVFTGQLTNSADTISIESIFIELIQP